MADASCSGPSPFKRLVDHQGRDVSHHQDRLRDGSSAGGHGAFRSQPSHPPQTQNDFGAFMDGNAAFSGGPHHAAGRLAAHAAALEPLNQQAQSPFGPQARMSPAPATDNWAADFAQFAGNQHQTHPQHAPQAPQHHAPRQSAPQMQPPGMAQAFGPYSGMSNMQPNGGLAPLYGPTNGGFMDPNVASARRPAAEADFDEEMSRWMAAHGGGAANAKAMEDVDAVMDQMARELEINDHVLDKDPVVAEQFRQAEQVNVADAEATDLDHELHYLTDLGQSEIGNLSHSQNLPAETQQQPQQPDPKARSEVSEAAERLLESVQHESGDKWKNSTFLSLMRDFRDGRKDIVDNEIRDQAAEDAADAAQPLH